MGLLGSAYGWGCPKSLPPPSSSTFIPYLRKMKKNIWITGHTPWFLLASAFFHWISTNFAISRKTEYISFWYIICNSFNFFFESLKSVLVNMVTILMMSPKIAKLDLLKIKLFWNNCYDVMISVQILITWLRFHCRCGHVTKVLWL